MFLLWSILCISLVMGISLAVRAKNKILIGIFAIFLIAIIIVFAIVILPGLIFAFSNWQF